MDKELSGGRIGSGSVLGQIDHGDEGCTVGYRKVTSAVTIRQERGED